MEIKCIVIDDEPLAVSKLENFISKVPSLKLLNTFDSAVDALSWIKENSPDLIFLDIQMETLTGMQFLESAKISSKVIITSAYDQYALKGYELDVSDYLLKPFSFERFLKAVDRVMSHHSPEGTDMPGSDGNKFIFIKTENRFERVDIEEILFIEGMKDYLKVVCRGRNIMTLQSFAKIEEILPHGGFCRVHRSFIVAINKIKSVERGVVIINGQRIPVSLTYKDKFYKKTGLGLNQG
jgi:two-component system, LytTR family, response regulator